MSLLRGVSLLSVSFLAVLSSASLAAQVPVDHMVVFGDSLSDNGNFYALTHNPTAPAYSFGRATDGPDTYPASTINGLWEEQLATSLGLAVPQPDLINTANLNFAFSGAETGDLANSASGPYGMAQQVQSYLEQKPPQIGTALHFFWGGTNDVFDYPNPLIAEQGSIQNISAQISSIAAAGGKYFVWLNLPPLDLTPRAAGSATLKTASANFATDMQQAIATLRASNPGIVIVPVDIYSLFKQVIQTPPQYGLTNVTTQSQYHAVNPDQYFFWDSVHPTTRIHQLIAGLVQTDIAHILAIPSSPVKLPLSDDFAATALNSSIWTVEAPPDATVSVANDHSVLSLPAGTNHDAFIGGNHSVRILQHVSNVDFDVAAKFDSALGSAYEGQGILVQQDDGTYLRFELASDGTQLFLSGASVFGGTETNYFSTPLSAGNSSLWLEVKRNGDRWTLNASNDGANYTTAGSFNQNIDVTAIGPFAWNYNSNGSAAPAITSLVDYFHNLAAQ